MSEAAYEVHVDIASSNYPHFDINTNSGEPFGTSQRLVVAENWVHHNRGCLSQVLLPMVE